MLPSLLSRTWSDHISLVARNFEIPLLHYIPWLERSECAAALYVVYLRPWTDLLDCRVLMLCLLYSLNNNIG